MHYKKEKHQKTDMKTMEIVIHLPEKGGCGIRQDTGIVSGKH